MKMFCKLSLYTVLFSLLLTSCTNASKDDVIKDAEQLVESAESPDNSLSEHFGYQEGLGDWLAAEEEYTYDEQGDHSAGITNLAVGGLNYYLTEDRLYFMLSKQTQLNTGDNLWSYISTKTGEKHYICPDPLCSHTREGGCLYINFAQLYFHPYKDTVVYAVVKKHSISSIVELDLQQNTIREIYNAAVIEDSAKYDTIYIHFIRNDVLYFRDRFVYQEVVDGEKILTEKTYLLSYDLNKQELTVLTEDLDPYIGSFYILNDTVLYFDSNQRALLATDLDMKDPVPVLTYEEGYRISNQFYDENTGELFLLVSRSDLHRAGLFIENTESVHCTLYSINKDLECTVIPLPSSLTLNIQLTNQYIYYTVYDPVDYTTSTARKAINVDGSKIYRVKRTDTTHPELVFDGRDELFFGEFLVTGDYLYLDYYGLIKRDESYFRRMGSSLRVNIKENTMKWINLD